jgi:hypothetical protein
MGFPEPRRKVRVGDLANLVGCGKAGAGELFGVLDRGDIRRARVAGASKAALEADVEANCTIAIRIELAACAGLPSTLATPARD